jgi:hypothetical protein
MKTRTVVLASSVACLVCVLAAVLVTRAVVRTRGDVSDELHKLREYCGSVRGAMWTDVHDFESDDPKLRLEAADRFYNFVTHHSVVEIDLCAPIPPDLHERDTCWLNNDYACLARLARLAMDSIPVRRGDDP